MKNVKISREVTKTEEKEIQIPEVSYRKDSAEMYKIDATGEKLKITGIYFQKKDKMLTLELYPEKEIFNLLDKIETTEIEWNETLARTQEFLKNY